MYYHFIKLLCQVNDVLHGLYIDTVQFTSDTYIGERNKMIGEHFKNCAQHMLNKMEKNSEIKVLEIGSGLSWMCRAVKELDNKSDTIAQDLSPECREKVRNWIAITPAKISHRLTPDNNATIMTMAV